jgi:hypothetical protein
MGKTSTSRPRTAEDIMALPVGPAFSFKDKIIDGKRWQIPVAPALKASFFGGDDLMAAKAEDGQWWSIGEYADGSWYRHRMLD